ncbi:hypothetical protein F2Q70_00012433 [Brassica cretica]|uniref:Uncharacterized protein n=1 Tax=Brassica cretica TaxID=69181 RepID=A0A8S9LRQ1_BRACR|nr:hypothetical protein F2Q68_00021085 [Brassica cretica]KAF2610700.1 hypothetical protein F2Q70_00012433 [Brassica cretica]
MTRAHQFHSRQGNTPHLENLLLRHAYNRLTPAVTIDQRKIYAHCSMSTTLLTGACHDLQLISRVPPCSLKHLAHHAHCSTSTGMPSVPAMCPIEQITPTDYRAMCSQGYVPIRPCTHHSPVLPRLCASIRL